MPKRITGSDSPQYTQETQIPTIHTIYQNNILKTNAIGRADFNLALTLTPRRQRIGCELVVKPSWKDAAFDQLESQRTDIENEIGATLEWQRLDGKQMARIRLEASIDPKDSINREHVKEWMNDQSIRFYKAFRERVKKLKQPAYSDTESDEE